MSLIWPEEQLTQRGTKFRPNPRPPVPKTGWEFKNHFPDLSGANVICFDVETDDPNLDEKGAGWARGDGHILGVAIGTDDGFKQYYPMRHRGAKNHNPQDVLDYCSEQLSRPSQPKLGHNVLYDLGWMREEGVEVVGEIHDTWTAAKLLDHGSAASLEALGQEYFGEGKDSDELYEWAWHAWGRGKSKSKGDKRKTAMKNLRDCPPELVGFYAESDVDLPIRIFRKQFDELQQLGLYDVYRMECDLLPILVEIRMLGVSVDLDAAEQAHEQFTVTMEGLQKEIDRIVGKPVNTGSPIDMEYAFSKLKIPFNRTKNGKMSLKSDFMESVEHPIGQKIVELQELKKYDTMTIQNAILKSHVNGKVHGELNPMRAITGRMSASKPNLQQVPSRNELAKIVRAIFIPDADHSEWRSYDYSSIESRGLAHFAVGTGAKALRREYRDNPDTDYHNYTHAMIERLVGLDLPRKHVKNVNFAGIYGASEKKLQSMMKLNDDEASRLFEAYHNSLPYVRSTMESISEQAEKRGYTETVLGRRVWFNKWEPRFSKKPLPALDFEEAVRQYGPNVRRAYLHKTLNYTIQGSAADLMKMAMVKCHKAGIYDEIGFPRLIVHDEKDYSVPENPNEEAFKEMVHIMETAVKFKVPIRVEGERGPNWADQTLIED